MSHAGHQVRETRSGPGGERVSGVPQVVKVEAGQAGSCHRGGPFGGALEVRAAEQTAVRSHEYQRIGLVGNEVSEMAADIASNRGRNRNGSQTCSRLGLAEDEFAVLALNQRRTDGERASAGIEVAAAQRGEFAVAQAREGREKDEGAKARRDLVGEVEDLGDGSGRPLGCLLGACALDAAGIAADQVVVDGRVQYGSE